MSFELNISTVFKLLAVTLPLILVIRYASRKSKAVSKLWKGHSMAQNIPIQAEEGASPVTAAAGRDAYAANKLNIYKSVDTSGERRAALRALKVANDGIIWAIDQSKNSRNGNVPWQYLAKLQMAWEVHYAKFTRFDLALLEPLLKEMIDARKTFTELELPSNKLNLEIASLASHE